MTDRKRIGLREVRALGPSAEIWDTAVPGFGARRQKGTTVSYVLMYRTREGRQRRLTIGRHGAPWTPHTARDEALRLLGEIVRGAAPAADKGEAREAMTVAAKRGMARDHTAGRQVEPRAARLGQLLRSWLSH